MGIYKGLLFDKIETNVTCKHPFRKQLISLQRNKGYIVEKNMENNQFAANWAQLVEDKVYFIVPADNYDVRNDDRLLIPYKQNQKIGFVNQYAEPIVEPQFDIVYGDIRKEEDMVRVGIRFSYGYARPNGKVQTYDRYKWGIINSKGKLILAPQYAQIYISDDKALFSIKDYEKGYGVINSNGNIVIPFGQYGIIDGFTKGYARVKKGGKWGIIDTKGKVVLPLEYDEIWNFHNKPELYSTRVIKDGECLRFNLENGVLYNHITYEEHNVHFDDDYGSHYGEYAGTYAQDVAGYSDDVINDAFDGEPDAYWNID